MLEGISGEIIRIKRNSWDYRKESNRLIELVNSSLDLSKMEAGMMVFRLTPTDIAPLIRKRLRRSSLWPWPRKFNSNGRGKSLFPCQDGPGKDPPGPAEFL